MIQDIVKLRDQGLSFREIAKELNTTVGKIQYRWSKHTKSMKNAEASNHEIQPQLIKLKQYIPSSYNQDKLCTMVKNPTTIYAYWDISSIKRNFLEHIFGQEWSLLPKFLKIYDVSSILFNGQNAHREFAIPLPEMTNNWFITELEPNRTYIVDLATQSEDGNLFTILRSNPIETPRNSSNQVGTFSEQVLKWKNGIQPNPNWLENFSTYSYYEKIK